MDGADKKDKVEEEKVVKKVEKEAVVENSGKVYIYRTHTNIAPGYYFLARLFGGSSNGIFSNTRPLKPTFY